MSDNEIRQILIQRKREEREKRKEMKREQVKEAAKDIACWVCWAALGYMMFFGAYMVG